MIPSCEGLSCALFRCSARQQPLPTACSSIPSSYANVLEGESHSPALPYFRTTVPENLHYHSIGKLYAYSETSNACQCKNFRLVQTSTQKRAGRQISIGCWRETVHLKTTTEMLLFSSCQSVVRNDSQLSISLPFKKVLLLVLSPLGPPRWLSDKEPPCQCRRPRRCGFNPWVRKIFGAGNGNLLQVFPGKFHDRGDWQGYKSMGSQSCTRLSTGQIITLFTSESHHRMSASLIGIAVDYICGFFSLKNKLHSLFFKAKNTYKPEILLNRWSWS